MDSLINWVEGFEAFKLQEPPDSSPYDDASEQFNSWVEGWMDAAYSLSFASDEVQNLQFGGQESGPVKG